MALYDDLKDDFAKILVKIEGIQAKQTKITFADIVSIFHEIVVDLVHASVALKDAGPDHKQAILDAAGLFFDNVLINIKLVQMPGLLKPIVDKFAREIFMELAAKSYDEFYILLNNPILKPVTPPVAPTT